MMYRRGIPVIPKKCWGKNVKFVDKKIFKKLIFNQLLFNEIFNSKGDQKINLEKIEKITPKDKT